MKVVLRADASRDVGTGHVMRQFALAEELIRQGAEVFLVGGVSGPSWLERKLTTLPGLQRISQPIGTFDGGILEEIGACVSTIDSYALGQSELAEWESKCLRTLVFIDGPWQRLTGGVAVAPAIIDHSSWIDDLRRRFDSVHAGPDFLMIRTEIRQVRQQLLQKPPVSPQILVVIGGVDPRGHTDVIDSALSEFSSEAKIVIMRNDISRRFKRTELRSRREIFPSPRSDLAEELAKSQLVISAAGTTTGELLFLEMPSIFIPVVDNQFENAQALETIGSSSVLWPDSSNFVGDLKAMVRQALVRDYARTPPKPNSPVVDGLGARRLAALLLSSLKRGR